MDTALFSWINGHHTRALDILLWSVSTSADLYLVWWAAGIAARLFDRDRLRGRAALLGVFLTLALSYVAVDIVLKPLAARPRPFAALPDVRRLPLSAAGKAVRSVYSFPSGHCASAASASVVLGGLHPGLRVPLAVFTGVMAWSRVYLGMHYPSDCLAGIAVGILCGLLALRVVDGRKTVRWAREAPRD